MGKIIRREKEYSTETLINVDYDPEDVRDYDSGNAPVSRKTQHAEELDDLVEFQKHAHDHDNMTYTQNYSVLNAVKRYDPDADRKPPTITMYDSEDSFDAADDYIGDEAFTSPEDYDDVTDDYAGAADDFDGVADDYSDPVDDSEDDYYIDPNDYDVVDDFDALDDASSDYEPRPFRPGDEGYEDIMEQFTSAPTKPKYWYEEFGDYWSCSCGHLNKGEICTNCGLPRELLRSLFILHKPGEEPGQYEGMPIKYEEVIVPKGRLSTKQKLIIAISIIAILLACGGFFTYYYMIVPSMEKEAAENLKITTETIKTNVADCMTETDSFFWDSYMSAGDACFKKGRYGNAVHYYAKAKQIKNTSGVKDSILRAKYEYIKAKQKDGGSKFERYLAELMAADYKDAASIYSSYYAWHFSIVANLDQDDYSTDIETASRADTVYFHVSVSGGPPDGTVNVYYEAIWPSGSKQTEMIGSNWSAGSKGYAKFSYPVPMFAKEGTLKFNLYDKSTQELFGSDSINLKK